MQTDISVLDRRDLIKLALDVHTTVASGPLFHVELADLGVWMDLLGTDHCMLRLRSDGRVEVDASGMHRGQLVVVCTKADVVRGVELPPVPEAPSVHDVRSTPLPVGELGRLELLSDRAVTA